MRPKRREDHPNDRKARCGDGPCSPHPLGNDIETSWDNLVAGKSGIGPITRFDATEYASRIAGEVKDFDPEKFMPAKQARRMDRFVQFAVATGKMLVEHSGLVIDESNADKRLQYVSDTNQALDLIEQTENGIVFLLNPNTVEEVMTIAEAGLKMPQKSTYFFPKVPSGLCFLSVE